MDREDEGAILRIDPKLRCGGVWGASYVSLYTLEPVLPHSGLLGTRKHAFRSPHYASSGIDSYRVLSLTWGNNDLVFPTIT